MPLIAYERKSFSSDKLDMIAKANAVIREYNEQGFNLTLRQLYYQFVSRDSLPQSWADKAGILNRPESYNKLGDLVSDGRMAGLIDWYSIVDRSRGSYANQHYDRPSKVIEAALATYATDKWENQPHYVEVWVEKEALEDVLARACGPLDVRYFACKGYTSQSAMWEAAQRLVKKRDDGKEVHIIHLGDHDPSGIDMSRDIFSRLSLFVGHNKSAPDEMEEGTEEEGNEEDSAQNLDALHVHVQRIALNMSQVTRYNPPPNPAKTTDSRFKSYQKKYGDESWELDALEPAVLVDLITRAVNQFRDPKLWDAAMATEAKGRATVQYILQYFPEVIGFLRERRKQDDSRLVCQGCGATEANPECRCDGGHAAIQLGQGESK